MGSDLQGAKNVICPACGQHQPYWSDGERKCEGCGRVFVIKHTKTVTMKDEDRRD